jgi:hypothetical protein
MPVYWGDLHSHCGVSYGHGSPQRALAQAQAHLDFCSITGHAFWPDLPIDDPRYAYDATIEHHLGGFAKLQHHWPDLLAQVRRCNVKGKFVTLPSYEWHSLEFGDHNCYFDSDGVPLISAPDLKKLAAKLRRRPAKFMLMPHHIGYFRGGRGLNWQHFDARVSPLIEIHSNHGCAEADDAPYDYYHSMGPRCGEAMARQGLVAGHRFGFCAGTDTHDGYPGHYGHGRTGAIAARLDRASIWEALQARRCIASTGARISAKVHLGGAGIGEVTRLTKATPLNIKLDAAAPIDKVELVEVTSAGWRVRHLPTPDIYPEFEPGRYKVKIEMGWGAMAQISTWKVRARVVHGKLLGVSPCFRFSDHATNADDPCDALLACDQRSAEWYCRSKQNPAGAFGGTHFSAGGTQSVILDIEAGSKTRLLLNDEGQKTDLPLNEVLAGSVVIRKSGHMSPAMKVHRAVPAREFGYLYRERYEPLADHGCIYLRITQSDGQVAWVSPIWYQ